MNELQKPTVVKRNWLIPSAISLILVGILFGGRYWYESTHPNIPNIHDTTYPWENFTIPQLNSMKEEVKRKTPDDKKTLEFLDYTIGINTMLESITKQQMKDWEREHKELERKERESTFQE